MPIAYFTGLFPASKSLRSGLVFGTLMLLLSGCWHARGPVIVREAHTANYNRKFHTVQPGETLYAIAWLHEQDHQHLAQINHIRPPFRLKVGQVIRLSDQSPPPNINKPKTRSKRTATLKHLQWQWPAQGGVIRHFAKPKSNKGIDIAGISGQNIRAAASGRVAYAGSGLRGYGKLLILKHSDLYLSAYAHNRALLVREGEWVKGGQVIAKMGRTGARRIKLHFEIRRLGRPVNPLRYLPKRNGNH